MFPKETAASIVGHPDDEDGGGRFLYTRRHGVTSQMTVYHTLPS